MDELDYTLEARNAAEFQKAMDERRDALGDSVFAPKVERGLSSRRILTAEWVVGRRIDAVGTSSGRICAITLAAYLAMLLETGCLHGPEEDDLRGRERSAPVFFVSEETSRT